jgi:hypothetical protein
MALEHRRHRLRRLETEGAPHGEGQQEWQRFGDLPPGWERVQAIVDFVHGRLECTAARRTRGPRRWTPTAPVRVSAATSPTWRSRSAARSTSRRATCPATSPRSTSPGPPSRGLRRLVRGLPRWRMAHLRRPQQPPPRRPGGRRARPRRGRRRADHLVRPRGAVAVRGSRGVGELSGPEGLRCLLARLTKRAGHDRGGWWYHLYEANRT